VDGTPAFPGLKDGFRLVDPTAWPVVTLTPGATMRTSVLVVSAFAAGIGLASAGYSMASVPVPTSVTVCFPERGAIQVPVNGSCPSGTRPVQSAGIASTTELANQVRALERQFVRDHHVDIASTPSRTTTTLQARRRWP
jgi:hypothetical protein